MLKRPSFQVQSARCPEVDGEVGQPEVQICPLELPLWPLVSGCRYVPWLSHPSGGGGRQFSGNQSVGMPAYVQEVTLIFGCKTLYVGFRKQPTPCL